MCFILAKGISEVLGLQLDSNSFIKEVNTSSQTRKKRWERWQNVESTFRVSDGTSFTNKNILLVDDVVTTGATLEASVQALKEAEASTVKIITLAASL